METDGLRDFDSQNPIDVPHVQICRLSLTGKISALLTLT